MNGFGRKMTLYANGELLSYIGFFEGSRRHGYGVMTYPGGGVREGFFENGAYIPTARVNMGDLKAFDIKTAEVAQKFDPNQFIRQMSKL